MSIPKKRRHARLQIRRWISPIKFYQERLSDLLQDPEAAAYVSDDFLSDLSSHQRRLTGYAYKVSFVAMLLLAALFLHLKVQSTAISLFGLSPSDMRPLKEIIAALSSFLSLLAVLVTLQRDYVLALLKASIDSTLKVSQRELAYRRFGVDQFSLPFKTGSNDGRFTSNQVWLWSGLTAIFLTVAVFLSLFVASVWISISVAVDIIRNPTFGVVLSYVFIVFIGLCNLLSVSLVVLLGSIPIPYWDNSRLLEIRKLYENENKEEFMRKYEEYSQ